MVFFFHADVTFDFIIETQFACNLSNSSAQTSKIVPKNVSVFHFKPLPYIEKFAKGHVAEYQKHKEIEKFTARVFLCPIVSAQQKILMKQEFSWEKFLKPTFETLCFNYSAKALTSEKNGVFSIGNYVLCDKLMFGDISNSFAVDKKIIFKDLNILLQNKTYEKQVQNSKYFDEISKTTNLERLQQIAELLRFLLKLSPDLLINNSVSSTLQSVWGNFNTYFQFTEDGNQSFEHVCNGENFLEFVQANHDVFWSALLSVGLKISINQNHCYEKKDEDMFEQARPLEFYFIIHGHILRYIILNKGITKIPVDRFVLITAGILRTVLGFELSFDFHYILLYINNYLKLNKFVPEDKGTGTFQYIKDFCAAIIKNIFNLFGAITGVIPSLVIKITSFLTLVIGFDLSLNCITVTLRISVLSFAEKTEENHLSMKQETEENFM